MYNQALGVCRGLAFWVMGWLLSGYQTPRILIRFFNINFKRVNKTIPHRQTSEARTALRRNEKTADRALSAV